MRYRVIKKSVLLDYIVFLLKKLDSTVKKKVNYQKKKKSVDNSQGSILPFVFDFGPWHIF